MRCAYAVEEGCVGKTIVYRTMDYGYYIERVRKCTLCGGTFKTTERKKVEVLQHSQEQEAYSVPAVVEKEPGESPGPESSGSDTHRGGRFPGGTGCF